METVLIAVGSLVPLLLILVVIHEFGHYATARAMGVKVLEFGVGFPPRAFGVYTGNTPVLIDGATRYVGMSGPGDLGRGQKIKVSSTEDANGNLVARVIESSKKLAKGELEEEPEERPGEEDLLKHEGKVRSVGDGSLVLADMLYSVKLGAHRRVRPTGRRGQPQRPPQPWPAKAPALGSWSWLPGR